MVFFTKKLKFGDDLLLIIIQLTTPLSEVEEWIYFSLTEKIIDIPKLRLPKINLRQCSALVSEPLPQFFLTLAL